MTDTLDKPQDKPQVNGKSVQEYIDELPQWPDGTALRSMPMTAMQFRIWALACAGKFFEGMVVFMTGVALPLISIQFHLNAAEKGMVTAASLAGILVGATALGGLADSYGRKRMFIVEMIIFAVFLVGLTVAPNFITLVICLFGAGIALGCDYPTAHMVISESIATSMRGRLVLSAFAFQAIGAFFGTALGFGILYANPNLGAWRMMYAAAIVPAILVVIGRLYVTESPHWLVAKGRTEEGEKATTELLKRTPQYPKDVSLGHLTDQAKIKAAEGHGSYLSLFKEKNRRATILASVPWFLQDLGVYGIGIFTPTILASVIVKESKSHELSDTIHNDILGQVLGHDGRAVRLGCHRRHLPGGQSRAYQIADLGLHRLRGGSGPGRGVHPSGRQQRHVVALSRFHAVLLHGQLRAERHDLSACRRGLPDRGPG